MCCCSEEMFSIEPVLSLVQLVTSFLSIAVREEDVTKRIVSILHRKASVSAYSSIYMLRVS